MGHHSHKSIIVGCSGLRFPGLDPTPHRLRWEAQRPSYRVQEKRPAHEVPGDVLSCHLLVTVRCKCHQQVGAHGGQATASKGQEVAPCREGGVPGRPGCALGTHRGLLLVVWAFLYFIKQAIFLNVTKMQHLMLKKTVMTCSMHMKSV